MSTHAAIIQHTPSNEYRGIYVHSDGYPDHTGEILTKHYTTDESIDQLIELGDLSGIGETTETCIAYHRDRGERKRILASQDLAWVAGHIEWDYLYLWEDGEWHTFTRSEFRQEMDDRIAWEVERAESEAGWDPNP